MRETVEQRSCHPGIAKHTRKFAGVEICRGSWWNTFVEPADQMEKQLAADVGKRQITELVKHEQDAYGWQHECELFASAMQSRACDPH
jgi:hypothetical protein